MTIEKTATDRGANEMTVVWADRAERVRVVITPSLGDPAEVELEPEDAREIAQWLLDAACVAALNVRGER